jgi:hypothetical protein
MFWWFKRGDSYVRYESRQNDNAAFELRIVNEDGSETVERFDTEEELTARQRALEQELMDKGWTGPHGWNV